MLDPLGQSLAVLLGRHYHYFVGDRVYLDSYDYRVTSGIGLLGTAL